MPFEKVYFAEEPGYLYRLKGNEIEASGDFHDIFSAFANYREQSKQTTVVNEVSAIPDFEFSMIQQLNTLMNSKRRMQLKLNRLEEGLKALAENPLVMRTIQIASGKGYQLPSSK